MKEDDNIFKIICQSCNGFVTCKGRIGELIYITFLHDGLTNLGLYPEEIDTKQICFQWYTRTKMQHMYQNFLKEGNGDHNFLWCTVHQDNNSGVLRSAMALNKVGLECAKLFKAKPTGDYSGFITYSNTTNFLVNG